MDAASLFNPAVILGLCLMGTTCSMTSTPFATDEWLVSARYENGVSNSLVFDPGAAMSHESVTFHPVEAAADCTLPRPSQGALVVFVESQSGSGNSPLVWYHEDKRERGYERSEPFERLEGAGPRQISVQRMNVVVTETSRPVYLVLAAHDAVLYNLQLAPDVRLDGVALISSEGAALANLPQGVSAGFITGMNNTVHPAQRHCFFSASTPFNADMAERELAIRYRVSERDREIFRKREADFRRWRQYIQAQTGAPGETISAHAPTGILIGEAPSSRLTYQPVSSIAYVSEFAFEWQGRRYDIRPGIS